MKTVFACFIFIAAIPLRSNRPHLIPATLLSKVNVVNGQPPNIFIVTLDGYRWQEIFTGADERLISNPDYTPDTALMKAMFWSEDEKVRRQKLMPFLWNVLSQRGQLYGNRKLGNCVNTSNIYNVSYPGYNEIFSGTADIFIANNAKKRNPNRNVLEQIDQLPSYHGKVVAFTSWDIFPYILNEQRSGLLVNSGYENLVSVNPGYAEKMVNRVQAETFANKEGVRLDGLTFAAAREYIVQQQPRVVFMGFGETDEAAHRGRYDLYLQSANRCDQMIAELWNWVQTTAGYKDNSCIVITTDHGRGRRASKWKSHSSFIGGSSETWLALMGKAIQPLGESSENMQLYQYQVAAMLAQFAGTEF
jgi:hypothetical protein